MHSKSTEGVTQTIINLHKNTTYLACKYFVVLCVHSQNLRSVGRIYWYSLATHADNSKNTTDRYTNKVIGEQNCNLFLCCKLFCMHLKTSFLKSFLLTRCSNKFLDHSVNKYSCKIWIKFIAGFRYWIKWTGTVYSLSLVGIGCSFLWSQRRYYIWEHFYRDFGCFSSSSVSEPVTLTKQRKYRSQHNIP